MTKKIISDEDSELFRESIGDVRAVKTDKVQHKPAPTKPKLKSQVTDLQEIWIDKLDEDISQVGHEETLSYTAPGIQKNVLAKLKKGYFGIQTEIDLHGLNGEAAKQQLAYFLQSSINQGRRCVHIIHGKGYRSQDDFPILKNNINRWLRQHKDVQAFCSASPNHGGAGAVFVLLRKNNDQGSKYD